jgi:DnaJ-class molecular chaperone
MKKLNNYYQVLGIDKGASQEEIKKAFRRMASLYHPDHNPQNPGEAEENFKEVNRAYEVLSDGARRRQYDLLIQQRRQRSREVPLEDFRNWGIAHGDILEELLRASAARSTTFDGVPKSRPWGCGRGRGRRRRFYSDGET